MGSWALRSAVGTWEPREPAEQPGSESQKLLETGKQWRQSGVGPSDKPLIPSGSVGGGPPPGEPGCLTETPIQVLTPFPWGAVFCPVSEHLWPSQGTTRKINPPRAPG